MKITGCIFDEKLIFGIKKVATLSLIYPGHESTRKAF
jgi:hypothetical protein